MGELPLLLLLRQILLVNPRDHDVVRIDHFRERDGRDLRQQLVGVEVGQPVVREGAAARGEACRHRHPSLGRGV